MSSTTVGDAVHGSAEQGYGAVADAFAAAVASSPRGGAALTVMVGGETVVDLRGGSADPAGGRSWAKDTATVMFSCSKGLLALLVARLVETGRIDLEAPVTSYWPEFGQSGKESIPVRWLLSHQAGLSYPVEDITKADIVAWGPVVEKLAAQAPLWTPGQGWAYHALTYGWLVGEVVRRVTGQSVGQAFAVLVAGPVDASAWFGCRRSRRVRWPRSQPSRASTPTCSQLCRAAQSWYGPSPSARPSRSASPVTGPASMILTSRPRRSPVQERSPPPPPSPRSGRRLSFPPPPPSRPTYESWPT
jgi:CubicO group peptidase (beta-lactamase class C family)